MTFNEKAAIRAAIELEVDSSNVDELIGKLDRLVNLIGLSAEIKARAIKDLKDAELIAYSKYKGEGLQASMFKIVIEGESSDQRAKLELADRLNAGLAHGIEGLRTIISLRKTEIEKSL